MTQGGDDTRAQLRAQLVATLSERLSRLLCDVHRGLGSERDVAEAEWEILEPILSRAAESVLSSWGGRPTIAPPASRGWQATGSEFQRSALPLSALTSSVNQTVDRLWQLATDTLVAEIDGGADVTAAAAARFTAELGTEMRSELRRIIDGVKSGYDGGVARRRDWRELVGDLLSGQGGRSLDERARNLGFDLEVHRAVLAVAAPGRLRRGTTLRSARTALLAQMPASMAVEGEDHPAHLVVVVDTLGDGDWERAVQVTRTVAETAGVLVMVGRRAMGRDGLLAAYRQALDNLHLCLASGRHAGAFTSTDLVLDRSLLALAPEDRAELADLLAPLGAQQDRDHLLRILRVLDDAEGNVRAAARLLSTHDSTIARQVRRIEGLTRLSLDVPDQRRRLYAAARLDVLAQHGLPRASAPVADAADDAEGFPFRLSVHPGNA